MYFQRKTSGQFSSSFREKDKPPMKRKRKKRGNKIKYFGGEQKVKCTIIQENEKGEKLLQANGV